MLGRGARGLDEGGRAEPTGRPGEEKGSGLGDCLPHRLPIFGAEGWWMLKWDDGGAGAMEGGGVDAAVVEESWLGWYWG